MDGIVTPEAVVLDVETAGVASRVFAGLIDFAIQMGALVVGLMLLAIVGSATVLVQHGRRAAGRVRDHGVSGALRDPHARPHGGQAGAGAAGGHPRGCPDPGCGTLLRMMGGLVDRYLPPLGVTGMLFVVGTARHQRVGDLISGTIVIRDPDRTLLPPAVWFPVPPGLEGFAATIDPTAMTDEQYTVIRSFLMRNRELSADARFSLATDLAGRVAATLQHDGVQRVHPEAYLLCVISRYQRRNFPNYQPVAWQPGAGRPAGWQPAR